jgi:hypothetical protein
MIRFTTVPLRLEGRLQNDHFEVPESLSTQEVLNIHARLWKTKRGSMDPELDLYNFVADRWPFLNLTSR